MKASKYAIPTILKLADGKNIVAEIEQRCELSQKSLRSLCEESQVSLATLWRMKRAQCVSNLRPLAKIEATFKKWDERR